jgi:hypothetical protein
MSPKFLLKLLKLFEILGIILYASHFSLRGGGIEIEYFLTNFALSYATLFVKLSHITNFLSFPTSSCARTTSSRCHWPLILGRRIDQNGFFLHANHFLSRYFVLCRSQGGSHSRHKILKVHQNNLLRRLCGAIKCPRSCFGLLLEVFTLCLARIIPFHSF